MLQEANLDQIKANPEIASEKNDIILAYVKK